jgi:hypothetical protein
MGDQKVCNPDILIVVIQSEGTKEERVLGQIEREQGEKIDLIRFASQDSELTHQAQEACNIR